MSFAEDADRSIRYLESEIATQQAANARIQKKIDRLKAERDALYTVYQDAQQLATACSNYDVSDRWAGCVYSKRYCDSHSELKERCAFMSDAILENRSAIITKINELERELGEGRGLISSYSWTIGLLSNNWLF